MRFLVPPNGNFFVTLPTLSFVVSLPFLSSDLVVVSVESLSSGIMLRDRRALDFAAGAFFGMFFSRANNVAGVTILASTPVVDLAEAFRLGGVLGALRSGSVP